MNWLHCYSMFICKQHPEKVREMWAYQATMIAEARKCREKG